jgi:hypothetical protein
MAVISFLIEVEYPDDSDIDGFITDKEAEEILSDLEEVIGKRSHSLFDSHWARED